MLVKDDRTPYLDLPMPYQFNDLPDDVDRLRAVLTRLDSKARDDDDLHQLLSDAIDELQQQIGTRLTNVENSVEALEVEVEETIVLTAGQTVINLAVLTGTAGATVFVEGVRLRKTEWTADPDVVTRLTLSTTYPAGHDVTVVRRQGGT